MSERENPHSLEEMLDRIAEAAEQEGERVRVRRVFELVGTRSFGPLLLLAGLITLAPVLGDIPGIPTTVGVFVFLISIQLIFNRRHFWLPAWLLNRSASQSKVETGLGWMRRPAGFADRLLRRRLTIFTGRAAHQATAAACLLIALGFPLMEVVPFSANVAGAALTAFGLSLVADDGLVALLAFTFTAATVVLLAWALW